MASLLARLGRWCATHAGRVIALWVALLLGTGAAAAAFGSPMSSEVSIPDADFQKVSEQLQTQIPQAAGGAGTVVITSTSGAFTDAQQTAIQQVQDAWRGLPHVRTVIDPFEQQATLAGQDAQLADGATQLADAKAQLDAGKSQLDSAQSQLAFGKQALASLEAANPADPSLPTLRAQLADGQAQYDSGLAQYDSGKAQYDQGVADYQAGVVLADAVKGTRFVSQDGTRTLVIIQFDTNTQSVPIEARDAIPASAASVLAAANLDAQYSVEITQDTSSLVGPGEIIGLALAGVVLVLTLGSLIAAGLPLAGAVVGVGVGLAGAVAASHFFTLNSTTPALALMLGLAVGIDYALFIVNRHRTQVLDGMPLTASVGRAVGTAGNAVIFAGSTVVIALTALVLSGLPILAQMGLVAAFTVFVSVIVAITLTPALLGLIGTRVVSRRGWRARGWATPGDLATRVVPQGDHDEEHGGWYVRLITGHPWLTMIGVIALIGALAIPALDLRLGLPDGGTEPPGSTARVAYDQVAESFGPGRNGPVVAVATLDSPLPEADVVTKQAEVTGWLQDFIGVRNVLPIGVSPDRTTLAFQVVLDTGPADAATVSTVSALRGAADAIGANTGTTIGFTGQTVANIEISEVLAGALPLYLLVVVGMSLVILLLVFRSVVVPLIATGGFLLSVAAAFGTTVAVYQWGWLADVFDVSRTGPIMSFLPIILIGVLFGLAMDYQMFLVSGMAEARAHGEPARRAVITGFVHGAKVVTAAAIIMASVFGGFVFSHLGMVRPMGFGLAVGVLVDALLVRMTLTPALMSILGERAWWIPRWLDRVLPRLDIEGTSLTTQVTPEDDGSTDPAAVAVNG